MRRQFAEVQTPEKNIMFKSIWHICHSHLDGTDTHVAILKCHRNMPQNLGHVPLEYAG